MATGEESAQPAVPALLGVLPQPGVLLPGPRHQAGVGVGLHLPLQLADPALQLAQHRLQLNCPNLASLVVTGLQLKARDQ